MAISHKQIEPKIQELNNENKIPIILDRSKNLEKFFTYQGRLCHVSKTVIGCVMKGLSAEESAKTVSEELRSNYVSTCKFGGTLVYHFGAAFPTKWASYCSDQNQSFNPDLIFDLSVCKTRDALAKIIKPSEDIDRLGNDGVWPSEELQLCFLFNINDDESLAEIKSDLKDAFGVALATKFEFVEVAAPA